MLLARRGERLAEGRQAARERASEVIGRPESGRAQVAALLEEAEEDLIAFYGFPALAKGAQVPFHCWLPNAMVEPTPVPAYLHSAAMVAAGVLLIGRTYPLLARSELVLDGMLVVGLASMLAGDLIALTRERLKQMLAYSIVAQYGYMVALYGLGGAWARPRPAAPGEHPWWGIYTGLFDRFNQPKPSWRELLRVTGGQRSPSADATAVRGLRSMGSARAA